MSASSFERENIVLNSLSADSATKPFEPAREHTTHEHTWRPPAEGLYDLSQEKDSCGVGFIANIKGTKSHQIVSDAIGILCNLEHRGAVGADPRAGDGAGILVQIPHGFFSRKAKELGFALPAPGEYAVGALFMPRDTAWRKVIQSIIADQIKAEGLTLLGWRDVPTDNSSLGVTVKPTEPHNMQVFIGRNGAANTEDDFERRLYILRKSISQAIYQRRERGLSGYYPCSLSCRTVIYKGMFLADQLGSYYPDLHEKDFESALKRTSVFSDSFQKIRLAFDTGGKKIAFSARNSDIGETNESVPASITGESVELSFNHRYLQAPLPLITTEQVSLSSAGIGRPLVIKGIGDTTFLYLVMPMNQ